MDTKENFRIKIISFRTSEQEKANLKENAKAAGLTLSELIRAALAKELKPCTP